MFLDITIWKWTLTTTHLIIFIAGLVGMIALYLAYFLKMKKMQAVDRYKRLLRKKPLFYLLVLFSLGIMGVPPFLVEDPKSSSLVIVGAVAGGLLLFYCLLYFLSAGYAKKRLQKLQS
ncbi:MAG: proton-conducting transporter membrane subunit [Planctomycetota bacterium]|mgnify:CR=1 FL=1